MWQDWLLELLKGFGKLFLNPVFYLSFLFAAFLGVTRVKKERRNFTVRAQNAYFELKQLLPLGLISGLCVSVLSIGLVLVVPMEFIIFTGVISIVLVLIGKTRIMSPVYTAGLGIVVSSVSLFYGWDYFLFSKSNLNSSEYIFPTAVILLGLLIISEGIFVRKNGVNGTSPRLKKSKRGQAIGIHLLERAWILPVFLFVPSGVLTIPFEWWPMFTVGDQTYSLLLVPFLIGSKMEIQGEHPIIAIRNVGRNIIILGSIIIVGGAAAYFFPISSLGFVLVAIIGREWITRKQRNNEKNKSFYFSRKNNGVVILGIVPDSPADKMELKIGEMISKVNSIPVQDKNQLYKALQKNSAHCKLEVFDAHGEIRFVQRALYEGDHHELGLLLIPDENVHGNEAV
ncbi:PDZ domain-containing protein [Niallia sp.]|uniref:PDZ domain-containing protein n=1 Tax=Niallia sp. TaxID=2837523 RepID=UPI00289FCF05|nr:PDZ domain-containing protein [Niallia sp.]